MSGRKKATISISDEDVRRLQKAEGSQRQVVRPPSSINAESLSAMRDIHTFQLERQSNFMAQMANIDERLLKMEALSNHRFLQMQSEMLEKLETSSGDIFLQTKALVSSHREAFESALDALRQQQKSMIEVLQGQSDNWSDEVARKVSLARQWLTACSRVCSFIADNYPHDYYLPQVLENLEAELQQAAENLDQGMTEAAFLSAQQLYGRLSETRLRLEELQSKHEFLRQAAWDAAWQLYERTDQSHTLPAMDLNGNLLDVDIDVDFWSSRKISRLKNSLKHVLDRIQSETELISLAECRKMLEDILPKMQNDLEDVVQQARQSALSSQLRVNIADIAVQALESQGYELVDAVFPRGDMRLAYHARLRNLEGNEVIIQVAPLPGEICRNDLRLDSQDIEPRSEHELRQRAREVTQALQRFGLKVGEMATMPQSSDALVGGQTGMERSRLAYIQLDR